MAVAIGQPSSGAATVDDRRRTGGSGRVASEASATNTATSSTGLQANWDGARRDVTRNEAQVMDQLPDTRIPDELRQA